MSLKRRLPAPVWIFLPLILAGVYALVYLWTGPTPDESNMPPEGAALVFRYRDFDALDQHHVFSLPRGATWSSVIGVENNLPGLPGIDRTRPVYEIKLPPNLRHDTTLVVFPLADPERFEQAFLDPDLLEKGRIRRPKEMKVLGSWGAVGPSRDAVNRVGTGTLVCDDRGEAWSLAVDVERLAELALVEDLVAAAKTPWTDALLALGMDVEKVKVAVGDDGAARVEIPNGERMYRVVGTWATVRLWSFPDERRIEAELVPKDGSGVDRRLDALAASPPPSRLPPPAPESDARMWLWVPGGPERALLVAALHAAGVELPEAWIGAEAPVADGGVLVFGGGSDHPSAVTIGVVAPEGALPDLTPFLGALPSADEPRSLAKGAAPLTVVDVKHRRPSPAGDVRYRRTQGLEMVGVGAATDLALDRMEAQLAIDAAFDPPPAPPGTGWRLVAAFWMSEDHAGKVLGDAVAPGGLFAALTSGPVEGALWTNGRLLRLDARASATR